MNQFFHTSAYGKLIAILCLLIGALLVFSAGMAVGYHEGEFSERWNANYMGRFAGNDSPFMPDHDAARNAHGAFGQVVAVRLPAIVIKGPSEAEVAVTVNGGTNIRKFHADATTSDIMVGDTVVVIGEPDDQGGITASLIRIVPTATSTNPKF